MKLDSARCAVSLPASLQKNLNLYAISASAAGVGALALAAPPAAAKVIYTPVHLVMSEGGKYPIDLNHDGATDFWFGHWQSRTSGGAQSGLSFGRSSYGPKSNSIVATKPTRVANDAVAIPPGKSIGSQRTFKSLGTLGAISTFSVFSSHKANWWGEWANDGKGLKNAYIGVKFVANNEIHYGWLRVSVNTYPNHLTGVLTGYAYETVPNKPIVAGDTGAADEKADAPVSSAPEVKVSMLGLLAAGAPALAIWRRE